MSKYKPELRLLGYLLVGLWGLLVLSANVQAIAFAVTTR